MGLPSHRALRILALIDRQLNLLVLTNSPRLELLPLHGRQNLVILTLRLIILFLVRLLKMNVVLLLFVDLAVQDPRELRHRGSSYARVVAQVDRREGRRALDESEDFIDDQLAETAVTKIKMSQGLIRLECKTEQLG